MSADDLPILGRTPDGRIIMGGFFTAHDTHGFHCDWLMPMFLEANIVVSVPYFACECLQHPNRDPDMVWPMLEAAHREAHKPFDVEESKAKTGDFLALRWTELGKPPLRDVALAVMREQENNGKAFVCDVAAKIIAIVAAKANQQAHAKDEASRLCPECGCAERTKRHHPGTFAVPECWFWQCDECEHQWGHE